jgi:quinol-cytochrome oxidoreductase complex cytochrome b subunit
MGKIFDRIDTLFHVKTPHKRFLSRKLPEGINYTYCLGGAAFTAWLLLAATGLMLSLYYVPSESEAYDGILMIQREVRLGWLVRGVHKWSATLLIVFILLHTLRVFISKAYRPPGELNWMAGVMGLALAFASGFTGYLLPWDQKAYWATEVGTSMAATVPVVGKYLLYLVRGGPDVDKTTLIRFYGMHVLWMPLMTALILWAHFHMIKRLGVRRKL